jgi:beta-glucosidase-like glycosyl hydrolase
MANSTLKALIAFDGIIMTDYLQDYMLAGNHFFATIAVDAVSKLCATTYR